MKPELMPTCPLMRIAWADALMGSITDPVVLDAFTADTGIRYTPPRCLLDRMIDDSTGRTDAIAEKFVAWFNEKVWGDLNIVAGEET